MEMKIRTIKYIIKEGASNTYKNKLMSLASISIVTASLIIFGIFYLITINLNYNLRVLKEQPEMVVYCSSEVSDEQAVEVEKKIRENEEISDCKFVSKKEAYAKVKEILGNKENLIVGVDESFLPVSFIIKLKNAQKSAEVAEQIKMLPNVEEVKYSLEVIEFITKVIHWMKIVSIFLISILLIVSILIISNTIKLTVFARRKEISIMKYIGSTDWFIRWPFVIEGMIIGFAGSIFAFILVSYSYKAFENKFNSDFMNISVNFNNFIEIIKINDIGLKVLGIYSLIGIVVGAAGSLISIRKYLRV